MSSNILRWISKIAITTFLLFELATNQSFWTQTSRFFTIATDPSEGELNSDEVYRMQATIIAANADPTVDAGPDGDGEDSTLRPERTDIRTIPRIEGNTATTGNLITLAKILFGGRGAGATINVSNIMNTRIIPNEAEAPVNQNSSQGLNYALHPSKLYKSGEYFAYLPKLLKKYSPLQTSTSTPTQTPEPSPTLTQTPEPSPTLTQTPEPSPTLTQPPSPSPTPTQPPVPSSTPTQPPEPSPTPTQPPPPSPTPTQPPEPSPTPTQPPEPSPTPTQPPEPSPTPTQPPEPSPTPTQPPEPTLTMTPLPSPGTMTPTATQTPITPPLPGGNLLVNPWFQDPDNPQGAGLYGWNPVSASGDWTCSIKAHNPANPDGSHTAARWAFGQGHDNWPTCPSGPGKTSVDAYLWQIVEADPSLTTLEFSTWWIVLWIDIAEANVYGSNNGQNWEWLWQPFETTENQGSNSHWQETPLEVFPAGVGYPFYKIEFHCRYPAVDAGCKITGVHFLAR